MSTSIAKLQAVNQSLQKRVSSALGRAKNAKDEATGKISAGEAVAWGRLAPWRLPLAPRTSAIRPT